MEVPDVLYKVQQKVLDESRGFLRDRGFEGCEGTALWIGRPVCDGAVLISRLFVPEQVAIKSLQGVAVDLTERAHFTLTDHLLPGERFYARIHSHPQEAYHSKRDDENPVLTHQGAISIVVPDFATRPLVLYNCAVYRLEHGQGWLRLERDVVAWLFQVLP